MTFQEKVVDHIRLDFGEQLGKALSAYRLHTGDINAAKPIRKAVHADAFIEHINSQGSDNSGIFFAQHVFKIFQ